MAPTKEILIYSADKTLAQQWYEGLRVAVDEVNSNIHTLQAHTPAGLKQALQQPALQSVVFHCSDCGPDNLALLDSIALTRSSLDLFAIVPQQNHTATIDSLLDRPITAYFDTCDVDYPLVLREIEAAIQVRASTPFADTLRDYVNSAKDAWHTPGHSSGDSLKDSPWVSDFYEFLGEHIFNADLSVSVQVLDSLLEPHSVISEAQQLAAKAFGARHTFFATNGTSTANKIILQSLLRPGDKILLDRGSHKSAHHGVILCGAMPVYLPSSIKTEYGLYGPVAYQTIIDSIDANPDAKVLLLTSCTYDGMRYDLAPIVAYAHQHDIKVIIDEAWYAHARFHPQLRPTALEDGADYSTQSTHKMLSAFSQASMIHVNDPDFDEQRFREHFNMHASTSPQYSIIASLDVARKQMSMEGFGLLQNTLALAQRLRQEINSTGVFRALELSDMLPDELRGDRIALDPAKITVDITRTGMTSDAVQLALFEEFNIQVEKTTFNTITLLLTIGTTGGKVMRLENALKRLAKRCLEKGSITELTPPPVLPPAGELVALPRDVFFSEGVHLPLMDISATVNPALVGAVCADQITPYPPGIPVLVPGQRIDQEVLEYLKSILLSQRHIEIHGLTHIGDIAHLRVAS